MQVSNNLRSALITLLKITVALGLIIWLVRSGKLDFQQLNVYSEIPVLLPLTILVWVCGPLLIAAYRWLQLLRGLDLGLPYPKVLLLQMIGLFFNAAMPGAVGGDVIKAVYIVRDQSRGNKTPAMLTILLDRILGLTGLFTIGLVAVLLNLPTLWAEPMLRLPVVAIIGVSVASAALFATVFLPFADDADPILRLLRRLPLGRIFEKIYGAFRQYRHAPGALIRGWLASVVMQLGMLAFCRTLAVYLLNEPVPWLQFATIFPLGIFTTAIPILPGGLGVGHVAFDRLFALIGYQGGANVFNAYFLGFMCLNLLGSIPYLLVRSNIKQALEHAGGEPDGGGSATSESRA